MAEDPIVRMLAEVAREHYRVVDPLGIVCSCHRKFRTMSDCDEHFATQQATALRRYFTSLGVPEDEGGRIVRDATWARLRAALHLTEP